MTTFTIESGAEAFRVDRRTLRRRLIDAGLKVERGAKFTIAEIHHALVGHDADVLKAIDRERLRNLTTDADLKAVELAALNRDLIPAADVHSTWAAIIIAIRQAIWTFDAPEEARRKWLGELRDLKGEDYFTTAKATDGADD